MQAIVRIKGERLQLLTGDPKGLDAANKLISTWPGWKRSPLAGSLPGGGACSLYSAAIWPSTIVPLLEQQQFDLSFHESLRERLGGELARLNNAKVEIDPPPSHHAPLEGREEWMRQPMPHQVQAIRALKWLEYRALLADDMGLGKTATSIWAWQQSGVPRVLIVSPKTVTRNWEREIHATLKTTQVFLVRGTAKQRATTVGYSRYAIENPEEGEHRKAVIINYDLLHRLPEGELAVLAKWVKGQFLILDESHYVKSRKAKRTGIVFDHFAPSVDGALCRLALTGTPVRNTLEDLWSQLQIVRPGIYASFAQFDRFHLIRVATEFKLPHGRTTTRQVVRGVRDREKLNAVINTVQIRRKKEDVLDLPPKIFTYPEFELDDRTAKVYKAMKDFALIELADLGDDTPIFAPGASSALEATMRLEQIAQGFLGGIPEPYLEKVTPLISKIAHKIEGRPGHLIFPDSAKLLWLKETIDSVIKQGGRPVVFSRFNTPMFWLVKQWEGAEMLHGKLNDDQRDDILLRFQDRGVSVLFSQIKLAEGWNATASQDVILYGRDWSPAVNAQAADRVHRIGQAGTVNVQVPLIVGTFEVFLHKRLEAKQADADGALKSLTIGELKEALSA